MALLDGDLEDNIKIYSNEPSFFDNPVIQINRQVLDNIQLKFYI